ncbi:MAG: DnaT-like ssDNA-binding protein, partial [Candidatus Hodarchaeota archaeon]
MNFVVEDGTGKSDATSYASVAQFESYWTDRGTDYTGTATDTKQAWLNLATEFIDFNYKFLGYATEYDTQALQWPRTGLRDKLGNLISDNSIPTELV